MSRESSPRLDFKRRSVLRHGLTRSISREPTGSPSRQLAEEFSKVFISDTTAFKRSLDIQVDEQERLHSDALTRSLAEHEAIRLSAERVRKCLELEIERESARRAAEEQKRLHKIRLDLEAQRQEEWRMKKLEERQQEEREQQERQQEEREQRERQQRERQQQERQQQEIQRERLQQEKRDVQQRHTLQEEQRLKDEQARRQAQEQETQEMQKQDTRQDRQNLKIHDLLTAPTNGHIAAVLSPQGILTPLEQREAEHKRYLGMHKQLKEMRKWVLAEAAKQGLKTKIGDMRRVIQKSLSIINAVDRSKNQLPTRDIKAVLEEAAKIQLAIPPKPFIVALQSDGQYPAVLLFLLNYFAKYIIHRFTDQVGRDPKAAEPYGVLVAQMFSNVDFLFEGHSMIDVLWAKYHKVCPVLFGITGNEKTVAGKQRLGWRFERDFTNPTTGSFVSAEEHLGNQAGLAAGFASITLRNFAKSRNKNPAPNQLYWTSLARVLSTPAVERTSTHYVVIRNMIEHSVSRFIEFFGGAAIVAMRLVFKQWPSEAINKMDPNVLALEGLPTFLERDYALVV